MTRPRVSVLLPVYDAEATLNEALASVAAQTLEDHEVVVVLNGCTDGSWALTRAKASEDPRIRPVVLPEADLVAALNVGLEACRAPLVARLDADDLMMPERLTQQVVALEQHPGWTVVATHVRHEVLSQTVGNGAGMARYVDWLGAMRTPGDLRAARFIDSPLCHPSVMLRRDAVIEAGGYLDHDGPEDYELWLRLWARGHVLGVLPEVLTVWRDHATRMTRTDSRYWDSAMRAIRHRYLVDGPLSGGRRARVWGAGKMGKRHARELLARGAQLDDVIDIDPRKIGGRVGGTGQGGVLPVVGADAVGPPDGRLLLLAVGSHGARAKIEAFLQGRGHVRERDYLPIQ